MNKPNGRGGVVGPRSPTVDFDRFYEHDSKTYKTAVTCLDYRVLIIGENRTSSLIHESVESIARESIDRNNYVEYLVTAIRAPISLVDPTADEEYLEEFEKTLAEQQPNLIVDVLPTEHVFLGTYPEAMLGAITARYQKLANPFGTTPNYQLAFILPRTFQPTFLLGYDVACKSRNAGPAKLYFRSRDTNIEDTAIKDMNKHFNSTLEAVL